MFYAKYCQIDLHIKILLTFLADVFLAECMIATRKH